MMFALWIRVDLLAAVLPGVLESKAGDPRGGFFCDDLQALDHARDDFVFKARVEILGIFADEDHVHVLESRFDTHQVFHWPHVGIEIEGLAQADVDAGRAEGHAGCERSLQRHAALADRLDDAGMHEVHVAAFEVATSRRGLPFDGNASSFDDLLDRFRNFGADPVSGD